jgi:PhzF family phenazine biosynthesis protein
MFQLPIFQIDAFTSHAFAGNPAAVCPLPIMLSDDILQAVAAENNLSETAFLLELAEGDEADYLLRWFTPSLEVDLCGHATLASAQVVFTHMKPDAAQVKFSTRSGILTVVRGDDRHTLDFPSLNPKPMHTPAGLGAAMGAEPTAVYKSDRADRDLMLVYANAATVRDLNPNSEALKAFAPFGFIATAPGDTGADGDGEPVDFVSRCFFPNHGIAEDPVTGSAHCVSAPYWAEKLGKADLFARQISARGGDLWLKVEADRVAISGAAVEVMQGVLFLPE